MSPRGAPDARGERALARALRLGLALVVAAALAVALDPRADGGALAALGVVLAAASPAAGRALALRLDALRAPALAVGGARLLSAAPLALALGSGAALVMGLLVLAGATLALERRHDACAAGAAVAPPVAATLGFALAPGALWLALFPAAVAAAALGALLVEARRAARRRRAPEGAPAESAGLALYALPLAAAIAAVGFALQIAVQVLPEPILRSGARDAGGAARERRAAGEPRPGTRDARDAIQQIFPSSIEHGGGVTQLRREVVMRVEPEDGRDHGPIYLRGMVLDVLTAEGATFRGGRGREHRAGPGAWVDLQAPSAGETALTLRIAQQPVLIRDGRRGVLFAPERLLAIDLAPVEHDPDGLLINLAPDEQWFRFRARAEERRAPLLALGAARARHPDPLYVALPRGPDARAPLARIAAEARRVTARARTDAERVEAVCGWFQREFVYALAASEFPGLAAVVDFLERRRGTCTSYAGAAALMLRSLGLPARIATGFVARDFDAGVYSVTTREGHAWIEVYFEGVGWTTWDPTPEDQRAAALASAAAAGTDAPPGLAAWTRDLARRLSEWAESGGESERLRAVADALAAAPGALARSASRRPLPFALAAAAAGLLVLLLRRRRGRGRAGAAREAPAPAGDPRAASLRARLLAALAGLGFARRPPETLREVARAARAGLGGGGADVPAAAALLDRARFGRPPLAAGEEAWVRAVVEGLERRAEPIPGRRAAAAAGSGAAAKRR